MSIDLIWYPVIFLLGFLFQLLLPGPIRMFLIYPLALALSFVSFQFSNFLALAFALGMTSRAVIGGYWICVILEAFMIIVGIAISFMY
jgi:hypothetical protein